SPSCTPSALSRVNFALIAIAAPPTYSDVPFMPADAPGFQKIDDASLHGALVAEKPRENAQDPISLSPNAWACADSGATDREATTARKSRWCRCISILRLSTASFRVGETTGQ